MTQEKIDADFELIAKARLALKEAVADTIEDHSRTGDTIVVWKNGKVVKVPAEQLGERESHTGSAAKERNGGK